LDGGEGFGLDFLEVCGREVDADFFEDAQVDFVAGGRLALFNFLDI
jgi:hypothetical protein